jgi:hypothetical protein
MMSHLALTECALAQIFWREASMKTQRLLLGGVLAGGVLFGMGGGASSQTGRPSPVQTPVQAPSQMPSIDRTGSANSPLGRTDQDNISFSPLLEEQQTRSRNNERQKRLQGDADRLLALAASLKQDLDKSDKSTASVDVFHKAEEIEKLAKSVKDHMKG